MRWIGIVGSEGAKFTEAGEEEARQIIRQLIAAEGSIAVSGHCHLGGVDIWAEEEADALSRGTLIYPPKRRQWNGGYKERNLQIARASNEVHCITVAKLPPEFRGMRFERCYHCDNHNHIKSGGCWTMKEAKKIGRITQLHVVSNA
jgi:hypothetical protein